MSTPRRCTLLGIAMLAASLAVPPPAHAARSKEWGRDFGTLSLALCGGVQLWSLSDLEESIDVRAQNLAVDGFQVGRDSFNPSFAYGLEAQVRLSQRWFGRLQMDWTRLSLDDRDRQSLQVLGGSRRTPVSLTYESQVQTHPLLVELGLGRSWRNSSLRFAASGGLVVAPIEVVDKIQVYMEETTDSEVSATGTGLGGEVTFSCDYFTESNMNVYLEIFGRFGGTDVELSDPVWESTILPRTRHVGLGGGGLRMGFRWI